MFRFALVLITATLLSGLTAASARAERMALIIGNSNYSHTSALTNPANDARDLAAEFTRLGYQVELVQDATRDRLLDALRAFRARSLGAEHSVIYYAGHGIEIDRQNFVVPVDAELKADIDVEYEAVPLDLLVAATSGAKDLQLVVLDACRDNPFLKQMSRSLATRSVGRGLALYDPDGNSLVAYAAREGTLALDGSGANSPYAVAFLEALRKPGLEIGQFFRRVRDSVIQQTQGLQEPFLYGSLSADPVFFRPVAARIQPQPDPQPSQQQPGQPSVNTLLAIDLAFWQSVEDSPLASDFEDYLARFPDGQFRPLAERRLAALKRAEKPARSSSTGAAQPKPETPKPQVQALPETPPAPLKLSREAARDMQARLNILGFSAGVEDGLPGPRTLRALNSYRSARNLPAAEGIDSIALARLESEVSSGQLSSHRAARNKSAPAAKKSTSSSKPSASGSSQTKTASAAKAPTPKTTAPASGGSVAGFAGKSYCRSKNGKALNGRNFSDRQIWCVTVLSASNSQIRYRVVQRQQAGKPLDQAVFTRSRSGDRTYGPVRLSSSGSISVNGATFVASGIYK